MQICHQIVAIAEAAGQKILPIYAKLKQHGEIEHYQKADQSPVTEADIAAHHTIEAALIRLFPHIPLLSEEQKEIPYAIRQVWEQCWLVDPLDGTKDFLAKNDEFTVNIALIEKGQPVLGVIHLPALGWTFFAQKGQGAFLKTSLGIEQLPCQIPEKNSVIGSRFHETPAMEHFILQNKSHPVLQAGSALKFGKVAMGEVALYPRFVGSSEWDIAAGHLIVTEAGGQIIDLSTKMPPVYNKPSLRNAHFIAMAAGVSWQDLIFPIEK